MNINTYAEKFPKIAVSGALILAATGCGHVSTNSQSAANQPKPHLETTPPSPLDATPIPTIVASELAGLITPTSVNQLVTSDTIVLLKKAIAAKLPVDVEHYDGSTISNIISTFHDGEDIAIAATSSKGSLESFTVSDTMYGQSGNASDGTAVDLVNVDTVRVQAIKNGWDLEETVGSQEPADTTTVEVTTHMTAIAADMAATVLQHLAMDFQHVLQNING